MNNVTPIYSGADERAVDSGESGWLRLKVAHRRIAARDIVAFDLESETGAPLPPFTAGAHVDVRTCEGLVRQYSICNAPSERLRYRLGILLDPQSRGGSRAIHEGFADGDIVEVGVPRNLFAIAHASRPALLFGGGIGITPVLAMAHEMQAAGGRYELHYCVRDASRAAFMEELEEGELAPRSFIHFDDGPPQQRIDVFSIVSKADTDTDIYVCGPAGFIDHVLNEARRANWPEAQLHSESFSASTDLAGETFTLLAERSGRTFDIPAGKSPADVLLEAGIDVTVSCQQGICGACLHDVIEGIPDHRDLVQSEEEKASNKQIALCCSRSLTSVLRVDV